MKITKKTNIKSNIGITPGLKCGCENTRECAIKHIKKAMEALAQNCDDAICKDSIANLSVVLLDLCPEKDVIIEEPEEVEALPSGEPEHLTNEGMVPSLEEEEL